MPSSEAGSPPCSTAVLAVGLLSSAGILGILGILLCGERVFAHGDRGSFHLPSRLFYAGCLDAGDDFAWCPNLFCGFDLHGEGQAGMYHPLHFFLYRALPFRLAFDLEYLLSFPFMFVGMYCLLRRWGVTPEASVLGAAVFTFSGFNLTNFIHANAIAVIAHLPWLLFFIDMALRDIPLRRKALGGLGVAVVTLSQFLIGAPNFVWYSAVAAFLYTCWLVVRERALRRLPALCLAVCLGILAAAVQLVPTWNALRLSYRSEPSPDFIAAASLPPLNLVQVVAPYLFVMHVFDGGLDGRPAPGEIGVYNGCMTVVLMFWLLCRWRAGPPFRSLALAAIVLGALALVLSLGDNTGLFYVWYNLPVAGLFRCPARYVLLWHFAEAVVAAVAFNDLQGAACRPEARSWPRSWPLAIPVLFSLAAAGLPMWAHFRPGAAFAPYLTSNTCATLGPALMVLAVVLVLAAAQGSRLALAGVVLFAISDQGYYGWNQLRDLPQEDVPSDLNPAVMMLRPGERVYAPAVESNVLAMKGLFQINGYVSLFPVRQLDYRKERCMQVACGGSAVVLGKEYPAKKNPLPRARLVTRAVPTSMPNIDIERVEVETTALVDRAIALPGRRPGTADIDFDRPGHIRVITSADSRQLLVVSERFHDGWQASVDAEVVPLVRVYGDLMGCEVPEGHHEVAFQFRPWSLRVGGWVSAGAVLVMGAWFVVSVFRKEGRPAERPMM